MRRSTRNYFAFWQEGVLNSGMALSWDKEMGLKMKIK
jgi:hypothetical protein